MELRNNGQNEGWSMILPPDKVVGVYGYDFRSDTLPAVELQGRDGNKLRDSKVSVSYVTRYQLNLNFDTEDFSQIARGARYVLRWPDQPEPNAISVMLIIPAQLKILGVQIPPTARARADLVQPVVDLVNEGDSAMTNFEIVWTAGPNENAPPTPVDYFGPGHRPVPLKPYHYTTAGLFDINIVAGGSATWIGRINVTPYANTPHEQHVHIEGAWPGGGEIRETKDFPQTPVRLGPDCVVDTSRGGGSFPQTHVDDNSYEFTISYDPGYAFTFDEKDRATIWRSFVSFDMNYDHYDPQRSTVTLTVKLRGVGGHGPFGNGPERFKGDFTVYSMCPS